MKELKPSVLVVVVYTDYKYYCKRLHSQIYESLTYENRNLLLVDVEKDPALADMKTGEEIAGAGRDFGMQYAKKHNFDYILQLDCDVEVPKDTIERLLATEYPLVGGATAARGDANVCIGHMYRDRDELLREPIPGRQVEGTMLVDGLAGACLLIAKEVFTKVDLSDYRGGDTIEGRHTMEDEYHQIKIFEKLSIQPMVDFGLRPWHYDGNGWAYKLWGEKKYWKKPGVEWPQLV